MQSDESSESPPLSDEAGDEEGSQTVFGNLPHTRPGSRSPRRDAQARARAAKPRAPKDPPRRPHTARERPQAQQADADAGGRGIEDVAWAGVAAAAEAATIGVRLATRALEAMRDTVDRR